MDQIIKDLKEENDGIQIEIKAMQTQNKATIADLKSQNDNVQFAKEKLQYDNLMMRNENEKLRNENSMLTEKITKLSKEKEEYDTLHFANEAVIEELKTKNLKLTKASEKCKLRS